MEAGQTIDLQLHAFSSHEVPPAVVDVGLALQTTGTYLEKLVQQLPFTR